MPIILPPAGRDTLVTLSQLNLGADSPIPDIIEENLKFCPEAGLFEAGVIDKSSYPALVRTGVPTAQFRNYNQGVEPSGATYRTTEVQTAMVDTRVECDRKFAENYHNGGVSAWQTIKASEELQGIMRLIGSQTYYGLDNDPNGFPGFWELVDPSMVVDVGGAVEGDGFRTSVWAVITGPQDVKHVYGNNQTLGLSGEWRIESVIPDFSQPKKKMEAYVNHWGGRPGLQVLSKNCLACAKNVTSDGAHMLTMQLLEEQLLEAFPTGLVPDYILMTRMARRQLRRSLITALNPNPPTPTEVDGVPIVVTDSISNAEAAAYN